MRCKPNISPNQLIHSLHFSFLPVDMISAFGSIKLENMTYVPEFNQSASQEYMDLEESFILTVSSNIICVIGNEGEGNYVPRVILRFEQVVSLSVIKKEEDKLPITFSSPIRLNIGFPSLSSTLLKMRNSHCFRTKILLNLPKMVGRNTHYAWLWVLILIHCLTKLK